MVCQIHKMNHIIKYSLTVLNGKVLILDNTSVLFAVDLTKEKDYIEEIRFYPRLECAHVFGSQLLQLKTPFHLFWLKQTDFAQLQHFDFLKFKIYDGDANDCHNCD